MPVGAGGACKSDRQATLPPGRGAVRRVGSRLPANRAHHPGGAGCPRHVSGGPLRERTHHPGAAAMTRLALAALAALTVTADLPAQQQGPSVTLFSSD